MPLIVAEYQSHMMNKDFEKAASLLANIPIRYLDKLARFLDSIDLKDVAFEIVQDSDHK